MICRWVGAEYKRTEVQHVATDHSTELNLVVILLAKQAWPTASRLKPENCGLTKQ